MQTTTYLERQLAEQIAADNVARERQLPGIQAALSALTQSFHSADSTTFSANLAALRQQISAASFDIDHDLDTWLTAIITDVRAAQESAPTVETAPEEIPAYERRIADVMQLFGGIATRREIRLGYNVVTEGLCELVAYQQNSGSLQLFGQVLNAWNYQPQISTELREYDKTCIDSIAKAICADKLLLEAFQRAPRLEPMDPQNRIQVVLKLIRLVAEAYEIPVPKVENYSPPGPDRKLNAQCLMA